MLSDLIHNSHEHKCLYCGGRFDTFSESIGFPSYIVDIFTCTSCKEVFEIHSLDEVYNVLGFLFTCKDICVFEFKVDNRAGFILGGQELRHKNGINPLFGPTDHSVIVNCFDIDFSDKEKLYKKLRTYLVFS
jgi:hypothetical protein